MCVTPTLKAARVATEQLGTDAFSADWLIHQHGYRWDTDGHRVRLPVDRNAQHLAARLLPGDVLLVDEAGMLDQDTAAALLTIADEADAHVVFVGDRHQLPAVGRGGVLDHATRWAQPDTLLTLDRVHRFNDPDYADLTLLMRTGQQASEVFDDLADRGLIVVHPTQVERTAHLSTLSREQAELVVADTREQVAHLNAATRDHRADATADRDSTSNAAAVASGEVIGVGDRVATRRNDRDLDVANRDTWTVSAVTPEGGLRLTGRPGAVEVPSAYAEKYVELAYATTVHGAQGETVNVAHLAIGEHTGAAAAYVGMTRGRHRNTAHLVAETIDDARAQWVAVFSRDRADLGPRHAARQAADDIDRYGPQPIHEDSRPRCPPTPPPLTGRSPERTGRGIGF